ncbi:MAG: hypothetical protein H6668_18235 [Ardenticatenaceae bacterium]|nr:hypothetical protein [Ardenticatenaceae bacterium]
MTAEHPRSRERFQALYEIGSQHTNATQWARAIGRDDQTVMGWVHRYNAEGQASFTSIMGSLPFYLGAGSRNNRVRQNRISRWIALRDIVGH